MHGAKIERKNMFDILAPWYDKLRKVVESGEVREITREIKKIEKNKQKHVNVLDVGAGTGNHWDIGSRKMVDLYLLDRNRTMLSECESDVNPVQGDVHSLPFEDNFFDIVICVDALHHFQDRKKSLNEMERVNKTGGYIFVADFDPNNFLTKMISIGEMILGEPGRFMKTETLDEFFQNRDYNTEKIYFTPYFYLFKSRKRG